MSKLYSHPHIKGEKALKVGLTTYPLSNEVSSYISDIESENEKLKETIKNILPVLQAWEPDHSNALERKAWYMAEKAIKQC